MQRADIEGFFSYYTVGRLQDVFERFREAMGEYTFQNHAYLPDDEHSIILRRGEFVRDGETQDLNEVLCSTSATTRSQRLWDGPPAARGPLIG